MVERFEVICIGIAENKGVIIEISHLGGIDEAGRQWRTSAEEAIALIESGQRDFYVRIDEHMFSVHVGEAKGRKWLRTHWDLSRPDWLLRLPPCGHGEPNR